MRLIDEIAYQEKIAKIPIEERTFVKAWETAQDMPTIDAVPVVRGEWKMDTDPDDGDCRCSSCKVCIDALHKRNHGLLNALGFKLHTFYKYCPNCGARMDGEKHE